MLIDKPVIASCIFRMMVKKQTWLRGNQKKSVLISNVFDMLFCSLVDVFNSLVLFGFVLRFFPLADCMFMLTRRSLVVTGRKPRS